MLVYKYLFESLFSILLSLYLGMDLLGHIDGNSFNFFRNYFPKALYGFTLLPAMYEGSDFSTALLTLVILLFKKNYYSCLSRCEVASHCGFNLHFPNH